MDINKRFQINLLSSNCSKTRCFVFRTINFNGNLNVCYINRQITNTTRTKFWGLILHDTLSLKYHIDGIMSKLILACFPLRSVTSILPQETLRIIYFSRINSVITYGIIFWGQFNIQD